MPIYEFKCSECGMLFETLVRTSDGGTFLECPTCRSMDLERQLSAFSKCASRSTEAPSCKPTSGKFS